MTTPTKTRRRGPADKPEKLTASDRRMLQHAAAIMREQVDMSDLYYAELVELLERLGAETAADIRAYSPRSVFNKRWRRLIP